MLTGHFLFKCIITVITYIYVFLLLCMCCILLQCVVLYIVNMHLQLPPGLNQITVHKIYHYININNLLAYGNKVWINHMARSDALKEETLDSSRKNSNPVSSVL